MKFTAFFTAVFFSFALTTSTVTARALSVYALTETEVLSVLEADGAVYGRVFTENTFLYSDETLSDGIFILPLTYYVKVTEYSPEVCRVIYCIEDYDYARGVLGYAKTSAITFVSAPPTGRSFPNIFPEFEGNGTFYKNNRFEAYYSASDTPNTSDAFFYGFYPRNNEYYCYVLRGGKFGYFHEEVFGDIVIPPHQDPKPVTRTESSTESAEPEETNGGFFSSDTNKAVFIAVTCIIAVCAVYVMFLPRRKKEPLPGDEAEYEYTED